MSTPKPGKPATKAPEVVPTKARTDKKNRHERQREIMNRVAKAANDMAESMAKVSEMGDAMQRVTEKGKLTYVRPEHLTQKPFGQHEGLRNLRNEMDKKADA